MPSDSADHLETTTCDKRDVKLSVHQNHYDSSPGPIVGLPEALCSVACMCDPDLGTIVPQVESSSGYTRLRPYISLLRRGPFSCDGKIPEQGMTSPPRRWAEAAPSAQRNDRFLTACLPTSTTDLLHILPSPTILFSHRLSPIQTDGGGRDCRREWVAEYWPVALISDIKIRHLSARLSLTTIVHHVSIHQCSEPAPTVGTSGGLTYL